MTATRSDSTEDPDVDRLYQLPLDQFVPARNELARERGRGQAPDIRALQKPNVLAWALNQLYWSKRETFERLVAAAARLRATQAQALLGKAADMRGAAASHREAIREALAQTNALLKAAGHAATPDATRELTGALEALPWKDGPGRLVRPPAASGFEALAGLPIAAEPQRKEKLRQAPAAQDSTQAKAQPGGGQVANAGRAAGEHAGRAAAERERKQAIKAAREAIASARRDEVPAAARLRDSERQLEAASRHEREARQALLEAERERFAAEKERRASAETLEAARRTTAEAVKRLAEFERGVTAR